MAGRMSFGDLMGWLISKLEEDNFKPDDIADRLSQRYSVLFILFFAILTFCGTIIGDPVICWCPKEFEGSWIEYTNNYCWVKNTYYLPFDEEIPRVESGQRSYHELLYYQWFIFIMIAQAMLFYLPSFIWHAFNQKSGVDCDGIVATAVRLQHMEPGDNPKEMMDNICNRMEWMMMEGEEVPENKTEKTNIPKIAFGLFKTKGRYLTFLYLFVKVLYLTNVIAQLAILNTILKTDYALFGYELLANALNGRNWVNSGSFPRVTMCDVTVRRLGNNHRYTFHCVLPHNLYIEKAFTFLWVWMFIVATVTIICLILWLVRFYFTDDMYRFVRGYLRVKMENADKIPVEEWRDDKNEMKKFVDEVLHPDGVFILRMIWENTSNLLVSDIISAMWEKYKEDKHDSISNGEETHLIDQADRPFQFK